MLVPGKDPCANICVQKANIKGVSVLVLILDAWHLAVICLTVKLLPNSQVTTFWSSLHSTCTHFSYNIFDMEGEACLFHGKFAMNRIVF